MMLQVIPKVRVFVENPVHCFSSLKRDLLLIQMLQAQACDL